MESIIIEVKENTGTGKVKMKVFSQMPLSDYQRKVFSSLTRDEAFRFGQANGWKVVDIDEWN